MTASIQTLRMLTWLRISHNARFVGQFPLHNGLVPSRARFPLGLATWVLLPGPANSLKRAYTVWCAVSLQGSSREGRAPGAAAPSTTFQNETHGADHVPWWLPVQMRCVTYGHAESQAAIRVLGPRARSQKPKPAQLSGR